jgi:DNA-binding MarR family transcriptional regulator
LILKALVKESKLTPARIVRMTGADPDRVKQNLASLESEGFIRKEGRAFVIGQ